jgi:squalene-hopene/tetraprenyl-beta-curcumene cyclase
MNALKSICGSSLILLVSLSTLTVKLPQGHAADPIQDALDRAAAFLKGAQNPDGGYGPTGEGARVKNTSEVGITALVVYALAKHPRTYRAYDGPFLSRAVEFLLSRQQPDGGFYDAQDPVLQNYRTSVALLALSTLDRVEYAEPIRKAQAFIKAQQHDESEGYEREKHLPYGAFGYGGGLRGDLSNSGYGAEALHESGVSASDELWRKLDVFLSRCQNLPEPDPLRKKAGVGTTGDGGFFYSPNDTRGPVETLDTGERVFSSYGSMTYQGLKTMLYAQVSRDDPRVQAAFDWISRNFNVRENPGMATRLNPRGGLEGLYYYYHTMAKALSVYGEPVITDARGVRHDWAKELSDHLLGLQHPEGYWVNATGRWWEDIPTLDTAYAMLALSICREELARRPSQAKPPAAGETEGSK